METIEKLLNFENHMKPKCVTTCRAQSAKKKHKKTTRYIRAESKY